MKKEHPHINIELITRYLAGEANSKERDMVDTWISSSDANKKEFDQLKNSWETIGVTNPKQEIDIDKEWAYLQNKIGNIGKLRALPPIIRIAASVVLLIGLAIPAYISYTHVSFKTQHAQTLELTLPDGSEVTLNANSKLQYKRNFQSEIRSVRLKGEAFFDVTPDSSLPFIIQVNQAEIRVLGTSFNVKAYKNEESIQVTVAEGKVSLYDRSLPAKKVIATQGEKAEFLKNKKVVKKTANSNQNYLAWKTRNIEFNNDNLEAVAKTIGEVYHRPIELKNPNATACSFTAQFANEDLETVLQVLGNTLDIEIEKTDEAIYLLNDGCE